MSQATESNYVALDYEEEIVNAATHQLGLVLGVIGTGVLLSHAGHLNLVQTVSCLTYAGTLVLVYAISTLSHAIQQYDRKETLRAWDQGVIYFLIVGTYTPFVTSFLPATRMWPVMIAMWSAAAVGFYSKVFARYRVSEAFSVISYIALGWLPALSFIGSVHFQCVAWTAFGGVCYTAGTLFLSWDRRVKFFHGVWHVFVMLGSSCHFYAIYEFVVTG